MIFVQQFNKQLTHKLMWVLACRGQRIKDIVQLATQWLDIYIYSLWLASWLIASPSNFPGSYLWVKHTNTCICTRTHIAIHIVNPYMCAWGICNFYSLAKVARSFWKSGIFTDGFPTHHIIISLLFHIMNRHNKLLEIATLNILASLFNIKSKSLDIYC